MNTTFRRLLIGSALAVTVVGIFVVGTVGYVQLRHVDAIYTNATDIPGQEPVAIVLGAAILKDGQPSDALRDRLLTGETVYREGKAKKILVTGDDGKRKVDEVTVMRDFLIQRGIPSEDILVDGHGYRTYESCKRARQVFDIREAIVVTQRFHLARALYLCNSFGIDSIGMQADLQPYIKIVYFWSRDLLSSAKAWWDVNIYAPSSPVKGF